MATNEYTMTKIKNKNKEHKLYKLQLSNNVKNTIRMEGNYYGTTQNDIKDYGPNVKI